MFKQMFKADKCAKPGEYEGKWGKEGRLSGGVGSLRLYLKWDGGLEKMQLKIKAQWH